MTYLFIGGPLDGHKKLVPHGDVLHDGYRRMNLRIGADARLYFFVHESLYFQDAVRGVFDAYSEQTRIELDAERDCLPMKWGGDC